jgi:hypothetical protein
LPLLGIDMGLGRAERRLACYGWSVAAAGPGTPPDAVARRTAPNSRQTAGSMPNDKKKHAKKAKRHRYKKKRQAMKGRKTGR